MSNFDTPAVFFSTKEVLKLLKIEKSDLYTILRPVRSKGELLPPIFKPEQSLTQFHVNQLVFTQRDILKMSRYFKALKEYKEAREELKKANRKVESAV